MTDWFYTYSERTTSGTTASAAAYLRAANCWSCTTSIKCLKCGGSMIQIHEYDQDRLECGDSLCPLRLRDLREWDY